MKKREHKVKEVAGIFDKNFLELISSEAVLLMGGLIAGTFLAIYTEQLFIIPGVLVILPGFLEMRGNISGSFASRLISGLFLRVVKPNNYSSRIVRENIFASFILALGLSLIFGLSLFILNWIISGEAFFRLILIPFIAGIIANSIEIPITLTATFYLFRKGHDPNNIIGPFITTTGDIVSVLSLLFAFIIIL